MNELIMMGFSDELEKLSVTSSLSGRVLGRKVLDITRKAGLKNRILHPIKTAKKSSRQFARALEKHPRVVRKTVSGMSNKPTRAETLFSYLKGAGY